MSLQIMFKLELVIKYKSLSLAWLDLVWLDSLAKPSRAQYQAQTQAQYDVFELEIQHKYIIKPISSLLSSLFGLDEWSELIFS